MDRLSVVTFSPPMRPAMRWPLKTRDGVAHWPTEPGARCTRWAPWEAGGALEAVTLHGAGEALAPAHGGDVDELAVGQQVDLELLADLVAGHVVEAELDQPGAGLDARTCSYWPATGLLSFDAFLEPKVTWRAL